MLYQDYQAFGSKQNFPDTSVIGTHYTERCKVLLVTSKLSTYVGHSDIIYLGDIYQIAEVNSTSSK